MVHYSNILKWTALISGIIITIFFLFFFVGEELPEIIKGEGKRLIWFFPFALPAFLGFIIAWSRPIEGGWILLAGGLIMGLYFFIPGDTKAVLIYSIPSILVGLCFLAAGKRKLI